MSQVVTLRLPDETAEAIRRMAQKERRSVSDVGARMLEEWVRQNRFAGIEFRSFQGERHACLKDRLQVWQVIAVAKAYEMDREKTARHLQLLPEQVQAAMNYYEAYSEEIEAAVAENEAMTYETLKRLLPNAQLFEAKLPSREESR